MGENMKKMNKDVIVLSIILFTSYLIAINFVFKLWSSLLLTPLVFILLIYLYNILNTKLNRRKKTCLFVLFIVIITTPQIHAGSEEFGDYSYPPFTIISDSKIDMRIYYLPKYFETEQFTGISTRSNSKITHYDLIEEEIHTYNFYSNSITEIESYAYFGQYLYVAGEYIDQSAGQDSSFSIMRVNLNTDEVESFMTSNRYLQVFNFYDKLLISFDDPGNVRTYDIYDETMTVVDGLVNLPMMPYINQVYNDGDYCVIVLRGYRYDLYYQGAFVKTLANYDYSDTPQYVYFHEDHIYINRGMRSGNDFIIDTFDMSGNKLDNIEYKVPEVNDFILFGNDYLIKNDGFYWDDLILWNSSSIYTLNDKPIYVSDNQRTLFIYDINHTLYGYKNGLYLLKEQQYHVLMRFAHPQKNFIYYLSFASVFLLIIKADKPLKWKKEI